ncbi:pteridine reductase [Psychrobacter sp. DM8]|uniref:pteridine reductase n=1 Tax=Psychrobacter sp. DM8 TaxID=3440636 RepID=UPI003F508BE7
MIDTTRLEPNETPVMLVTGSAKRIGAAIIEAAHTRGYRVIIHCHHSKIKAQMLAAKLNDVRPNTAAVIMADLAIINDSDLLNQFVQDVVSTFGQLDVLVHNASRFYPTPIGTIDSAQWDELLLTNAKAPLFLSQALLPYLKQQQGCIISLLDIHAQNKPFNSYTVYNMAKAAHQMLVQSLALEVAPDIRVNGVAPGVNILPDADSDQAIDLDHQQRIVASIPIQRVGTPEDIAEAVLFLAKASYITGEIINVDGGRRLTLAGGTR